VRERAKVRQAGLPNVLKSEVLSYRRKNCSTSQGFSSITHHRKKTIYHYTTVYINISALFSFQSKKPTCHIKYVCAYGCRSTKTQLGLIYKHKYIRAGEKSIRIESLVCLLENQSVLFYTPVLQTHSCVDITLEYWKINRSVGAG
jgi:hypothetical protein